MKLAGVILALLTLAFVFGAEAGAADEWEQMYGPDIPPPYTVPYDYDYAAYDCDPIAAVVPVVVPAAAPVWITVPGSALSSCDAAPDTTIVRPGRIPYGPMLGNAPM